MGNDISVSRMTLGTVQLGLNYGIANSEGKPDEGKAFRIIDAALAAGVNCLDTAAAYGDSEKVIGNYLTARNKRRSEVVVATKFKLGNINLADVEYEMMRSVESSLKSLDTDYLDILLMHDAKEYSLFGKRITKVFESLLNKGTIKAAGASCYEFGDIEGMLENDTYHAFQIPVNILDMRFTKSEVADKLSDKLVFARSIFLQGLFFRAFGDTNMMPMLCLVADHRYLATGYGILNFLSTIIGGIALYAGGVMRDSDINLSVIYKFAALIMVICAILLFMARPKSC